MTGESLTPRLGRLGSHCRLGVNDRESLDRGVTDNYDTGSFMATITHPTGNGHYRDRILRDRTGNEDGPNMAIKLIIAANK